MSKFNILVEDYITSRNDILIPTIYEQSIDKVKQWMFIQRRIPISEFPEGFLEDVVLTFISRLYDETVSNKPIKILLAIANSVGHKYFTTNFVDGMQVVSVESSVDKIGLLRESIDDRFVGLSELIKSTILYLLLYPSEYPKMLELHKNNPEFYCGLVSLLAIKKQILQQKDSEFVSKDFTTQTSKALLLSSLYSIHPALVVLFLQMGDVSKFLQFCILFSGQTIQIPTTAKLKDVMSKASAFGNLIDEGKVVTDYRLVPFVTELDKNDVQEGNFNFTPVLSQFLQDSLTQILEKYDRLHDRVIKGLNICDAKEVKQVYKVLSKELVSQIKLMQSVNQSFEFVDSLKGLSEQLASKGEKE